MSAELTGMEIKLDDKLVISGIIPRITFSREVSALF